MGNTRYYNTGDYNTGDCNAGNYNTGNCNAGDCNAGDYNTGDCNAGNYNTGNCNAGNCNAGDCNTGWFNTNEPKARFFNKECDFTLTELYDELPYIDLKLTQWIPIDKMSEQEKKDIPYAITTQGYLKTIPYKEAFQAAWKTLDNDNKQKFLNLPNFDPVIFKEITGVDVQITDTQKKALELEQEAENLLKKARELRNSL